MAGRWHWGGPILALIGLCLLGVGLWFLADTWRFAQVARPAVGEVLSVERQVTEGRDAPRSVTDRPTLRYTAETGETHVATSRHAAQGPGYAVGQSVGLLYDPANPMDVRIGDGTTLWVAPGLLTLVGALLLVAGGLYGRRHARRARSGRLRTPAGRGRDSPTIRRD